MYSGVYEKINFVDYFDNVFVSFVLFLTCHCDFTRGAVIHRPTTGNLCLPSSKMGPVWNQWILTLLHSERPKLQNWPTTGNLCLPSSKMGPVWNQWILTLLHSVWPKLQRVLAVLSAMGQGQREETI